MLSMFAFLYLPSPVSALLKLFSDIAKDAMSCYQSEISKARINLKLDVRVGKAKKQTEFPLKLVISGDFSNELGTALLVVRPLNNSEFSVGIGGVLGVEDPSLRMRYLQRFRPVSPLSSSIITVLSRRYQQKGQLVPAISSTKLFYGLVPLALEEQVRQLSQQKITIAINPQRNNRPCSTFASYRTATRWLYRPKRGRWVPLTHQRTRILCELHRHCPPGYSRDET